MPQLSINFSFRRFSERTVEGRPCDVDGFPVLCSSFLGAGADLPFLFELQYLTVRCALPAFFMMTRTSLHGVMFFFCCDNKQKKTRPDRDESPGTRVRATESADVGGRLSFGRLVSTTKTPRGPLQGGRPETCARESRRRDRGSRCDDAGLSWRARAPPRLPSSGCTLSRRPPCRRPPPPAPAASLDVRPGHRGC